MTGIIEYMIRTFVGLARLPLRKLGTMVPNMINALGLVIPTITPAV